MLCLFLGLFEKRRYQGLEGVQNLEEHFYRLIFGEILLLFEILVEVALVAVLQNEVEVVGRLFDVEKLDDVFVVASAQHLDFVFEQLVELACLLIVPLTSLRWITFTAMSWLLRRLYPLNTSPNCPEPILRSRT
jgi:hypothetical protein